ncbi:TPA: hypothetical protein ENX78_08260 [Candidatus Poribacteria bacterium]|nr:hypothetical protein [Candidatus Poribacteria bacterium]
MADRLLKYYDYVKQYGGLQAQMRLAMITCIPSTKAANEPDSPENIEKFKKAVKEITGKDAPLL